MKVPRGKEAVVDLIDDLEVFSRRCGFETYLMGEHSPAPLYAFLRENAPGAPTIYVSAGIHGDEPAGPLALLEAFRRNLFSERLNWHVLPALNPQGLSQSTRENAMGIDLNRDYRSLRSYEVKCHVSWLSEYACEYACTLHLHEDWEASGAYLYQINPDNRPTLAHDILERARAICGIDTATTIDGWPAQSGLIQPDIDPARRPDWPETLYLMEHHSRQDYTFETPSFQPIERRVQAHLAVLEIVSRHFARKRKRSALSRP